MLQDLVLLMQLQEIDLRIKEQELAQEHFPAQVAELEKEIARANSLLDHASERHLKAQKENGGFDDQILKAKDNLGKSQERLNNIKTNREYDAVHSEIESQKHIITSVETKKRNSLEEVSKLVSAVGDAQELVSTITKENEPKIKSLKKKISLIDSTIAEITKERDAVIQKIGIHILRPYDLIRKKRKNGKALSLIASTRNCSVCYKVLPPQLYNEIKRGLKLIICESCGSIMVWNGDYTSKE